jgi:SAM-dependent methyltransferase
VEGWVTDHGRDYWNSRYSEKELLWTAEPNRFLPPAVEGLEPGDALDLAGGEGRNAVWLAKQGWRVTVLDWADVALDKGRALAGRERVEVWFTQADLRIWWPPEECADLCLIAYLQVPHEERHGVWRAAVQALRPSGRLVVIGHHSDNLTEGYGGPQSPEALFTPEEVVEVVGDDLEVLRAERVDRPVENEDGEFVALDLVVVADKA